MMMAQHRYFFRVKSRVLTQRNTHIGTSQLNSQLLFLNREENTQSRCESSSRFFMVYSNLCAIFEAAAALSHLVFPIYRSDCPSGFGVSRALGSCAPRGESGSIPAASITVHRVQVQAQPRYSPRISLIKYSRCSLFNNSSHF